MAQSLPLIFRGIFKDQQIIAEIYYKINRFSMKLRYILENNL